MHLLLFHCCPIFVVLNNDLIFICHHHGYNASPMSHFFFGFGRDTVAYIGGFQPAGRDS